MKTITALAATALVALTAAAQADTFDDGRAQAETLGSVKVGMWTLSTHGFPTTGAWSHCAISADYQAQNEVQRRNAKAANTSLVVKAGGNFFEVMVGGSDWDLTPDKQYPVSWKFTDGSTYNGTGQGSSEIYLSVYNTTLPTEWIKSFIRSEGVQLYINGRQAGAYRLTGSARAFDQFADCLKTGTDINTVSNRSGGGRFD